MRWLSTVLVLALATAASADVITLKSVASSTAPMWAARRTRCKSRSPARSRPSTWRTSTASSFRATRPPRWIPIVPRCAARRIPRTRAGQPSAVRRMPMRIPASRPCTARRMPVRIPASPRCTRAGCRCGFRPADAAPQRQRQHRRHPEAGRGALGVFPSLRGAGADHAPGGH